MVLIIVKVRILYVIGAGQHSLYSDSLRPGPFGVRIPVGGEIFNTLPDRFWGPNTLLYNRYCAFLPGIK